MSWYKIVDKIPIHTPQLKENLTTTKIKPLGGSDFLTIESQFFIASTKFHVDAHIVLPLNDPDEVLQQIQTRIIPHFERCIGFIHNEHLIALTISGLKSSSREKFRSLFSEGLVHPLITDLYHEINPPTESYFGNVVPDIYQINCNLLIGEIDQQFEPLASLICNTYLAAENSFTVIPTGWSFGEHLLQSLFLKAISMICNEIYLYVNPENGRVLSITGINV